MSHIPRWVFEDEMSWEADFECFLSVFGRNEASYPRPDSLGTTHAFSAFRVRKVAGVADSGAQPHPHPAGDGVSQGRGSLGLGAWGVI
ncbi:hypothetical protein FOPE_04887 [Fonsecaea pedrosoi]|nr:hypothetical protein FOPE_04887 [Fonsecaea pedrosoi]